MISQQHNLYHHLVVREECPALFTSVRSLLDLVGHGAGLDPVLAVVISRFIPEEEKGPFSKVDPLLCVIAFIVRLI